MAYTIEFSPGAARQFKDIPKKDQVRIKNRINALAENPYPPDTKKLTNEHDLYRIRTGDYRVIYTVRSNELIILIVKIGHRREIYRGL
ncbi:MAG: type II toxin-antitoxin system RelE/ParE family toxin [bacterium]